MRSLIYVIALFAGFIGIIASFVYIRQITPISEYLVMGGFVLLAVGYPAKSS